MSDIVATVARPAGPGAAVYVLRMNEEANRAIAAIQHATGASEVWAETRFVASVGPTGVDVTICYFGVDVRDRYHVVAVRNPGESDELRLGGEGATLDIALQDVDWSRFR